MSSPLDPPVFVCSEEKLKKLAKTYRVAVDGGEHRLAETAQQALKELADGQASLARAALLTAFANSDEA